VEVAEQIEPLPRGLEMNPELRLDVLGGADQDQLDALDVEEELSTTGAAWKPARLRTRDEHPGICIFRPDLRSGRC
jgi:hypothetical protein